MEFSAGKDLAVLQRLTVKDLRIRYAEAFGETTRANNRAWLIKRIAWRLQAQAYGDLSERARQRARELANDADVRLNPPRINSTLPAPERTFVGAIAPSSDQRLPPPGTVLTRAYKGRDLQVTVLPEGFEFEGEVHASLSAVAKAITGSHCNGFLFFKLANKRRGA